MIIFHSTKKVGIQSFLVFANEIGSTIEIPVDPQIESMFLHYFDRLSPGTKPVETEPQEDSKGS